MANGVIVESRIQATNIDALNRTAQAQIAVAGGGLVALTESGVQGNEVWTAAAPASGTPNEGNRCGCGGAQLLPADGHDPEPSARHYHQSGPQPPGYPQGYGRICGIQKEYFPLPGRKRSADPQC